MLYTSGEFPAFFRFLSNPADLAFLSEGRIHDREVYDRVYLVVLYASGALYPSVRRIFAGYFSPAVPYIWWAYFIFTAIFGGYMVATALTLFIALRIVHGFAFGMVTVAGNTILIDILPSSRRGEGIGYYGLANNIAMSFGPMIGLFMQGTSHTT